MINSRFHKYMDLGLDKFTLDVSVSVRRVRVFWIENPQSIVLYQNLQLINTYT